MATRKRKTTVEWIGGLIRMPAYAFDDHGVPVRPMASLWCASSGQVVAFKPFDGQADLADVVAHLLASMTTPLAGSAPDTVRVATRELADAVRAVLPASLEVVCAPTPEIDAITREMGRQIGAQPSSGDETYLGADLDRAVMSAFFHAAARLHRAAPWAVIDAASLLGVDIESLGVRNGVLATMGNLGDVAGFFFFDSLQAFEENLRSVDASTEDEPQLRRQLVVDYQRGAEIPPAMRKEVVRNEWEVACADAYPSAIQVDDDGVQRPAVRPEVICATALAGALADLIEKTPELPRMLADGAPVLHSATVDTGAGEVFVRLTVPIESPGAELLDDAYLDALLDQFEASPERRTLGGDARYAPTLLELAGAHFHVGIRELTPKTVRSVLFELVPALVAAAPKEARAIIDDTRAMVAFLGREGMLEDGPGCLKELGTGAVERLEKALAIKTPPKRAAKKPRR